MIRHLIYKMSYGESPSVPLEKSPQRRKSTLKTQKFSGLRSSLTETMDKPPNAIVDRTLRRSASRIASRLAQSSDEDDSLDDEFSVF